jgi:cob(I)alamin adenosyltransferase
MSITTKTGDAGTTALMYGKRVPKTHVRVECYGTVDELNAALGLARALAGDPFINDVVLSIQKELVALMGELAVAEEDTDRYRHDGYPLIDASHVDRITQLIKQMESEKKIDFKGWATPGATAGAGALDVARTVCRRAERLVVALEEGGSKVNPETKRYLNRVSDLCWLLARFLETSAAR